MEKASQFSTASQSLIIKLATMMPKEENIVTLAETIILSKSKNVDMAELEFYENASRFSVERDSERLMEHLLKQGGNAARALVSDESFQQRKLWKEEAILDELVELLIKSDCDETRIGAAKVLSSGKVEDEKRREMLKGLGKYQNFYHLFPDLSGRHILRGKNRSVK